MPRKNTNENEDYVPVAKEYNYSKWTPYQNSRYAKFLRKELLKNRISSGESKRLPYKFFTKMSKVLGSIKTSVQCRTHHQKLFSAHGSIDNILNFIKN